MSNILCYEQNVWPTFLHVSIYYNGSCRSCIVDSNRMPSSAGLTAHHSNRVHSLSVLLEPNNNETRSMKYTIHDVKDEALNCNEYRLESSDRSWVSFDRLTDTFLNIMSPFVLMQQHQSGIFCRSMIHFSFRHLHFIYVIAKYTLHYYDDSPRHLPSYFHLCLVTSLVLKALVNVF